MIFASFPRTTYHTIFNQNANASIVDLHCIRKMQQVFWEFKWMATNHDTKHSHTVYANDIRTCEEWHELIKCTRFFEHNLEACRLIDTGCAVDEHRKCSWSVLNDPISVIIARPCSRICTLTLCVILSTTRIIVGTKMVKVSRILKTKILVHFQLIAFSIQQLSWKNPWKFNKEWRCMSDQ